MQNILDMLDLLPLVLLSTPHMSVGHLGGFALQFSSHQESVTDGTSEWHLGSGVGERTSGM